MSKYFKITDYTFIIVTVLTVIVLAVGVFSIDYVLNKVPDEVSNEDEVFGTEPIYEDEINVLDEDGNFKKYYISVQDTSFSAEIESLTIDVSVDSVSINGLEILNGGYPTKYMSFYGDYLVMPFIYNDHWYGGLIVYDVVSGKYEIVDKIDDKYIYNDMESFTSSKEGILLNLSIVNDDKIYVDKEEQDICSSKKSKKLKVKENIFIKYNQKKNKLIFDKYDTISSISLDSYRNSNNLCQ